jgi:hypothetical protein
MDKTDEKTSPGLVPGALAFVCALAVTAVLATGFFTATGGAAHRVASITVELLGAPAAAGLGR